MVIEPAASSPTVANRRTGAGGSGRRRQPPRAGARPSETGRIQVAVGGRGWLDGELQPVHIAAVHPLEPARGDHLHHGGQAAGTTHDPLPLRVLGAGHNGAGHRWGG
jgi:hypothetical protein